MFKITDINCVFLVVSRDAVGSSTYPFFDFNSNMHDKYFHFVQLKKSKYNISIFLNFLKKNMDFCAIVEASSFMKTKD